MNLPGRRSCARPLQPANKIRSSPSVAHRHFIRPIESLRRPIESREDRLNPARDRLDPAEDRLNPAETDWILPPFLRIPPTSLRILPPFLRSATVQAAITIGFEALWVSL